MAAGITLEIARKVRREKDAPGENEFFILIQDCREWFSLGDAAKILFRTGLRNPKLVGLRMLTSKNPGMPLPIRSQGGHSGQRDEASMIFLTGMGTLQTSIRPAGRWNQDSRRLRRASISLPKSGVSVRSTSNGVRSARGTSAATRMRRIGVRCAGSS